MNKLVLGLATLILCIAQQSSTAKLVHRWSFDSDGKDSVGKADGKLEDGAKVSDGRVVLDGEGAYVELPIGDTIAKLGSATIEAWVTWDEDQGPWARIFDFGEGQNANMYFTPRHGRAENDSEEDTPRFVITQGGFESEEQVNAPEKFPVGKEIHLVVTIDAEKGIAKVYIDGKLAATQEKMTVKPSDLGNTPNNWLGASQYMETDPLLQGSISEFRIYDAALSDKEVANNKELGPDKVAEKETAEKEATEEEAAEKETASTE
jgi:hypothetical protein